MRRFNPGPGRILLLELLGGLSFTRRLQGVILLSNLEPHDAGLNLGACTTSPRCTRGAILARKAGLECHPAGRIGMTVPGDTLFARRAGDHVAFPIHNKLEFVKTCPLAGLPTGVFRDWANNCHPIVAETSGRP